MDHANGLRVVRAFRSIDAEAAGRLSDMADQLRFTIHFTDGGDGWVMAQVEEVPGAISRRRTRDEARQNVIDALHLMLQPEPGESPGPDRELLTLPLAS